MPSMGHTSRATSNRAIPTSHPIPNRAQNPIPSRGPIPIPNLDPTSRHPTPSRRRARPNRPSRFRANPS